METVIRSPQSGVIKKLAHKEGVSTKFNFILLLFYCRQRILLKLYYYSR